MNGKQKDIHISIRLNADLYNKLIERVAQSDMNVSEFIRQMIRNMRAGNNL